jgi:hypothetical protein
MLNIRWNIFKWEVIQTFIKSCMFCNLNLSSLYIIPQNILGRIMQETKENTFTRDRPAARCTCLCPYSAPKSPEPKVEDLEGIPPEFREFPFQQYIAHAVDVMAIRATAECLLWHQRLGHPSGHYLYHAHEHIDDVLCFKHFENILNSAKQKKEAAEEHSTRTVEQPFQVLSIDFSFAGDKSKDEERKKDFTGINGETCRILVTDDFTRAVFGDTRVSKASPVEWLRSFLRQYSPHCTD